MPWRARRRWRTGWRPDPVVVARQARGSTTSAANKGDEPTHLGLRTSRGPRQDTESPLLGRTGCRCPTDPPPRRRPRRCASASGEPPHDSSHAPPRPWPAACCSRARGARSSAASRRARATIDTQWPIKRVIYVMLENRSFNNLFGAFPGVEGTSTGVSATARRCRSPPARTGCPATSRTTGPPTSTASTTASWTASARDSTGPCRAYTQMHEPQIPNYWEWAQRVRALGPFLRVGGRAVLPEPLLLRRRHVGWRHRQPGEHRGHARATARTTSTRAGAATRSATTCSCSRRTSRAT